MTDNRWLEDEFALGLLGSTAQHPAGEPRAHYDEDGDCIEFVFGSDDYFAERVDSILTVYYSRETGEIVGSLVKCVKRFIQDVLKHTPGFMVDVQDGKMRLEYLFTARLWQNDTPGQPVLLRAYKKLRYEACHYDIEVDVPALTS